MGSLKWGISPLIWVIITVTLLITVLITTHEAPGRNQELDPQTGNVHQAARLCA